MAILEDVVCDAVKMTSMRGVSHIQPILIDINVVH